jgi:glycosyltransferase involved in cell wall biosynthesis
MSPRIAVLIPCLNEERSITAVVRDFARALPGSTIYVYDNNSTDESVKMARKAGAVVGRETRQGKGHTVRRMFHEIDADIYVLVDGDGTYDARSAAAMVELLRREQLMMVVGSRTVERGHEWRLGHRAGNRLFTRVVSVLFRSPLRDVLSGYRVFSRGFVKSFQGNAEGFEIEVELTVHALTQGMPLREMETPYRSRQAGSWSKLNTWSDGFRILRLIFREYYGRRTERVAQVVSSSRTGS